MGAASHRASGIRPIALAALAALCLLCAPASGAAQENAPVGPPPPEGIEGALDPRSLERSVKFSYIGPPMPQLLRNLFYLEGGDPVPVHSSFHARGSRQRLSSREELVLGRKVIVEEKEVFQPVVTLNLQPNEDHFWVILYPTRGENGAEIGAFAYQDGMGVHPRDTVRIHNLTPYQLRSRVDSEVFELAPREDIVHEYDVSSQSHVAFDIYLNIDGKWVQSYLSSRQIREDWRMNLFVLVRPDPTLSSDRSALIYTFVDDL